LAEAYPIEKVSGRALRKAIAIVPNRAETGHHPTMPPPCRLYLITPPAIDDLDGFAARLVDAIEGGDVGALQVRLKTASDFEIAEAARRLGPICRRHDVALILNDRPDLAARLDCDGVHIGQSDMTLDDARRAVGRDRIVGVTCHDSRHLAMEAAEGGADYVAFGAFFPTATKETTARPDPEILEIWQETMVIPCVAIGGITPENCEPLVTAGADFLAVSAGVWSHPSGPAAATRSFAVAIARGMAARATP
jgi:thiamine-phosphate pyrophosphorylase